MSDSPYRYNEIDFLSVLLAFQAGQVSPEVLQQAIQNYVNSSCSLCENVEALAEIELDDFVIAARKRLSHASQPEPMAAFASLESAAGSTPASMTTAAQQQPSWEDDDEAELPENSHGAPSEFWSHIYYADDVIRSYTAGWMGLGATACIAAALVAVVWAALAFPSAAPHVTVSNLPISQAPSPDPESITPDSERESPKAVDRPSKNSSVVLASKNEDASPKDSPLAGLLTEDQGSQPVAPPVDLDPVVDLIESKDLPAALKRLEEICEETNSPNEACERLAIGIRMEMESDSSIQEAGARIAALKDFDHPATTLLFCRWAMNASQEQRMELYERFQKAPEEKKLAVRWLSSLCGGHVNAVKELSVSADNLMAIPTHLFLASAHFRSAERQQALEQLDALDRQLKEPKSWYAEDRSERWLMVSSIAAIAQGAEQLRSKLVIRKPNP